MNVDELSSHTDAFTDFSAEPFAFLASVAEDIRWYQGDIVFEEDQQADTFYVITAGRIGLELTAAARPPIVIQTLGPGDLLGLSWLFPPYRWNWRARATVDTTAIAFDAMAARERLSEHAELQHEMCALVAQQALKRLHGSRTQLLNLYETGPQ